MPLLTQSEAIASAIASQANTLAQHLSHAIHAANGMSATLAAAGNDALAEYLNARGRRLQSDLESHAAIGGYLNSAAQAVMLAMETELPLVDVSSFTEKMAATGRTAAVIDGRWFVADIVPPPVEQEPTADIQPEPDPE